MLLGPRPHGDRLEMSLALLRVGLAVLIFIHGAFALRIGIRTSPALANG